MNTYTDSKIDKAMEPEQFNQIVDAILDGKYSWACVLILRFAGYNPVHYIPYRTYYRLMKEHRLANKKKIVDVAIGSNNQRIHSPAAKKKARQGQQRLADLSYLESARESLSVTGGCGHLMWGDAELDCFAFN
ncbi:HetP family heterocyst commitment protein [Synechococcus sp. PCC 7336]|uniref:HetP family heterocyst commitment protein n=1 Tax=Synechococcus sp. PCC 7336 TaxID=195250 RepID=UPI00034526AF|nr:HetP family heterocyst commitment protein [Synechococcus sp. PCC 7336]